MITDRPPADPLVETSPPPMATVETATAIAGERLRRRQRRRRLLREELLVALFLLVALCVTVAILATQWLASGSSAGAAGVPAAAAGPPQPLHGGAT